MQHPIVLLFKLQQVSGRGPSLVGKINLDPMANVSIQKYFHHNDDNGYIVICELKYFKEPT